MVWWFWKPLQTLIVQRGPKWKKKDSRDAGPQAVFRLKENGRGDRIRTCDPLFPKQMRYQAAPLPDIFVHALAVRENPKRIAILPASGGPGRIRTRDLAVMSGQL